jgi:drug/metabolite transporter superfamily protein YnfA
MQTDRSVLLSVVALLIALLSYGLILTSVHTYCENRWVAALFGVAALLTLVFIIRNRAVTVSKKVLSGLAMSICLLSMAVDIAFIVYATRDCRHMFDQLK